MQGQIWVAQKPGRGSKIPYPAKEGYTRIDVTSGSGNKLVFCNEKVPATQMSPLYLGPEHQRFENTWQYSKVYPQLGHWDTERECPTPAWTHWKLKGFTKTAGKRKKGIRTPPEVSTLRKKFRETGAPWTPRCSWWNNEPLDYIEARKKIYVPLYAQMVVETDAFKACRAMLDEGKKLLIIDLDGPPLDAYPNGAEVTRDFIAEKLNDPSHPFGHGYVVAALLAGINPVPVVEWPQTE